MRARDFRRSDDFSKVKFTAMLGMLIVPSLLPLYMAYLVGCRSVP